jgi:hypothetical protein
VERRSLHEKSEKATFVDYEFEKWIYFDLQK